MPVDHRRINGPEETVPYELFCRKKQNKQVLGFSDIENLEHPKIFLETKVVSQAKGSAYIEIGSTKVIVSVFDPREIPNKNDYALKGELFCEFKFAPFSCSKRKLHQQNGEEKQFSSIMKKALEPAVCLYEIPNFQVEVYAMVIEDDGSALSAAITAAGVALAEAGVPMYDLVTSVTLATKEDQLYRPLSSERERQEGTDGDEYGFMVMSKLHAHEQICQFYHSGYISPTKLKDGLKVLSKMCDRIVPLVQKCLVKKVINNLEK